MRVVCREPGSISRYCIPSPFSVSGHEGWEKAQVKGSDAPWAPHPVSHPVCLPGSAGDFNFFFFFPAKAGKIDSFAGDVPVSTVGFFLFLQQRWRSTGDKRISAASLGGEGSRLLQNHFFEGLGADLAFLPRLWAHRPLARATAGLQPLGTWPLAEG